MSALIYLLPISAAFLLFDRVCLWLEYKEWLYYRYNRPQTGVIKTALQELNAYLLPSQQHVIIAKNQNPTIRKVRKIYLLQG
ncbi:hypothetical protein ACQUW5_14835 [Legionella sp. CNM-1927-20]|uniref:hypothetical protein n=1 Tax=Legionella sp. CNM-1927-20 TaxID=3422221 RepID=UPI00403B3111